MEPIKAFRTIEIPIDLGDDEIFTARVPMTVELLHRVEDTLMKMEGRVWFRLRKKDQHILEVLEEFCRPYFPKEFDFTKKQPIVTYLFFSNVRDELRRSIDDCTKSIASTSE